MCGIKNIIKHVVEKCGKKEMSMKQGKKWNSIINWSLFLLALIVVFFAIRNDLIFNEERHRNAKEITAQEDLVREQMSRVLLQLKEITIQLDSIFYITKDNSEIVFRIYWEHPTSYKVTDTTNTKSIK